MTAQIYLTIIITGILLTIPFAVYISVSENTFGTIVKRTQENIIRRMKNVVPECYIADVEAIIEEELNPLKGG